MATTEARMKQLTGAYADLNKSNMLVGEMAVPSDHVPVVRNGVNSWEDLLTSQSAGDIIALSETMTEQIESFEQLVVDKVGINDSTATLTQAYSGSKTQGLIDGVNTNLSTKASQSSLDATNIEVSTKAEQSDLSLEIENRINDVDNEKSERQAEILVERNRITNLATLSQGSTTGDAELIDARVGADGITDASLGTSTRRQFKSNNDNIDFIKKGYLTHFIISNLLQTDFTIGYYIEYNSGVKTANSNMGYYIIPCFPLTNYVMNYSGMHIAFFDSANVYISGILSTSNTDILTPSNCRYIAISIITVYKDGARLTLSGFSDDKYIPRTYQEFNPNVAIGFDSLSDVIVYGKNLFNKYSVINGYYIPYNTGGNPSPLPSYCYTNFYQSIKSETSYYTNNVNAHICFYDINKKYISGSVSSNTFQTPVGACYMVISIPIANIEQMYVIEGSEALADYEPYCYEFKYSKPEVKNNYVVVDINGNGDYTSVMSASANEPAETTIYVMPGVYDNEVITGTWSKKQYIIGTSKKDCIIKNHKGDYNNPPIQIGSGLLKNLTFYSENNGTPSEAGGGSTGAYAVHSESNNLYNGNLTIENCVMKSDWASGFGLGMRGGCDIILDRCDIISAITFAMLFHDADNDDYIGTFNISLRNCLLNTTAANSKALILQSQEKVGSVIYLEMLNNRLQGTAEVLHQGINYYGGTGGVDDFLGAINFRLKNTSWGNSDSVFNSL